MENNKNKEINEPTLSDEKLAKFLSGMTNDAEEEEVMQYVEKHPETLTSMQNVVSSIRAGRKKETKKKITPIFFSVAASVAVVVVSVVFLEKSRGVEYVSATDSVVATESDKFAGTWTCDGQTLTLSPDGSRYHCVYTAEDGATLEANGITKGDSIFMEFSIAPKSGNMKNSTSEFLRLQGAIDIQGSLSLSTNRYTETKVHGMDQIESSNSEENLHFVKK